MNQSQRAYNKTYKTIKKKGIGGIIRYYSNLELNVIRDSENDIVGYGSSYVNLFSHPRNLNPSQKDRDKAGVKEYITAIFEISVEEFRKKVNKNNLDLQSYDFNRDMVEVEFMGVLKRYNIDTVNFTGAIDNGYRYIILACVEKT